LFQINDRPGLLLYDFNVRKLPSRRALSVDQVLVPKGVKHAAVVNIVTTIAKLAPLTNLLIQVFLVLSFFSKSADRFF
jgi:hypothetical protein